MFLFQLTPARPPRPQDNRRSRTRSGDFKAAMKLSRKSDDFSSASSSQASINSGNSEFMSKLCPFYVYMVNTTINVLLSFHNLLAIIGILEINLSTIY